jgi:diaminohydroxyphosphoribosylaminopyrimidine deaminase / 5-amino-6-(5-phosphoribosylamino)uracil reductase
MARLKQRAKMKTDHSSDEVYMRRVFQLARLGKGSVSPNPLVGCIIVRKGQIIGEGWHRKYGEAHAEVNAIDSVTDKNQLIDGTVFVNLEPCSHFGKTPPCADLLVKHKVKRVVISNLDTNPLVSGGGVRKLREAGIEVVTGILANEGRHLNRRFFTYMEQKRPYIILKWAQTSDGFIARANYDSKWISNEYSRQVVHKWRAHEDAILVGNRTAAHDNPSLTVRDWTGRNPLRVVIDRFLKLDDHLNLFDGSQKTFCYNLLKHEEHSNLSLIRVDENDFLLDMLHHLWQNKIQSLIVEGGTTMLNLFLQNNLWDEARVFISPRNFHKGIAAPLIHGQTIRRHQLGDDALEITIPQTNK